MYVAHDKRYLQKKKQRKSSYEQERGFGYVPNEMLKNLK